MTVYQYDINSAYANTYRTLPCMVHAHWEPINVIPKTGFYVAEVIFSHPKKLHLGTLPVRDSKGTIIFPVEGRGVYWNPELAVARKYGVKLKLIKGFRYVGRCDCKHFDFIDRMYEKRKQLGKDGKGMVLKIALASTYGKLVQSVGTAPYANPVWGGLITSTVRSQLIDAALSAGNGGSDVVMLATDGMFCLMPRDLPLGTGLGEWTETQYPDMFIAQSGVYFLPGKKPKTRGVPQSKVIAHEQDFRDAWQRFLESGDKQVVNIPLVNFIGIRLALARNKPEIAGQWMEVEKNIAYEFTAKRVMPHVDGQSVETSMVPGSPGFRSIPYPRMIGGHLARAAYEEHIDPEVLAAYQQSEQDRLVYDEQPDWGDQL